MLGDINFQSTLEIYYQIWLKIMDLNASNAQSNTSSFITVVADGTDTTTSNLLANKIINEHCWIFHTQVHRAPEEFNTLYINADGDIVWAAGYEPPVGTVINVWYIEGTGTEPGPASLTFNNMGFNGPSWFTTQSEQSLEWLITALAEEQTLVFRFRPDDDPGYPINVADVIALHVYMEDNNRHLSVIYCANIKTDETGATPAQTVSAITDLLNAGVNIIAVEAGNEFYSYVNLDFPAYVTYFEPVRNAIRAVFPTLPFTIFIAPRPAGTDILGGRSDHKIFNDLAIAYMLTANPIDGISTHIYFNSNEVPEMISIPASRNVVPGVYYSDLDIFYRALYNGSTIGHWENSKDYVFSSFPGRKIYITEFGYVDAGLLKNTIAYGMGIFRTWLENRSETLTYILEHSGISQSLTGYESPTNSARDLNPGGTDSQRRVNYFVFQLVNQIPAGTIELPSSYAINAPGTYYFWFINTATSATATTLTSNGVVVVSAQVKFIQGAYMYSTAGFVAFQLATSQPTYEIDGIDTATYSNVEDIVLPSISLGYIKIICNALP